MHGRREEEIMRLQKLLTQQRLDKDMVLQGGWSVCGDKSCTNARPLVLVWSVTSVWSCSCLGEHVLSILVDHW